MEHHRINVERTAHYYTLGTPGAHVRQIWFVLHGYGQLASAFLSAFETELDLQTCWVVAPEGNNYFYQKGFAGAVVANWMTRHERLDAIADNNRYLQALYDHCQQQVPEDVRIVVLGFSQGTATACRWLLAEQPRFHDLLLWAGMPPEDLDYAAARDYLQDKNLYLLYGSHDPFLTPDRIDEVRDIESTHNIDFLETPFEGGHEIAPQTLRNFLANFK